MFELLCNQLLSPWSTLCVSVTTLVRNRRTTRGDLSVGMLVELDRSAQLGCFALLFRCCFQVRRVLEGVGLGDVTFAGVLTPDTR